MYHQDGVEFTLEGDEIPGFLKGSKKGNVFITTQRVSYCCKILGVKQKINRSLLAMFHSLCGCEIQATLSLTFISPGDILSYDIVQVWFIFDEFSQYSKCGGEKKLSGP